MNRNLPLAVAAFLTLCMAACADDEGTDAPVISNLTVTPIEAMEFADSVLISFDYTDRNGDLGHPDPNVNHLTVKDSRLEFADTYHVQPLAPLGEELEIQGRLTVKLNSLFVLGNSTTEKLQFSIQLQDRGGNTSNLLVSDTVMVVRQ
jgi:hypothetical protein